MKKFIPYFIAAILLIVLAVLIIGNEKSLPRKFDKRVTLKSKDKIPYGYSVAKSLIPLLFKNATVTYDVNYPGDWGSVNIDEPGQAVVIVADYFDADENELLRILNFTRTGNYVFIIARTFSIDATNFFHISDRMSGSAFKENDENDELKVSLNEKIFGDSTVYTYPGFKYASYFFSYDKERSTELGSGGKGYINFIQMQREEGSIYIHTVPLAFLKSNGIKLFATEYPYGILSLDFSVTRLSNFLVPRFK